MKRWIGPTAEWTSEVRRVRQRSRLAHIESFSQLHYVGGAVRLRGAFFVNTSKGHYVVTVATVTTTTLLTGITAWGRFAIAVDIPCWARPLSTQARAIHVPLLRHYDHDTLNWYHCLVTARGRFAIAVDVPCGRVLCRHKQGPSTYHCCDITTTTFLTGILFTAWGRFAIAVDIPCGRVLCQHKQGPSTYHYVVTVATLRPRHFFNWYRSPFIAWRRFAIAVDIPCWARPLSTQ